MSKGNTAQQRWYFQQMVLTLMSVMSPDTDLIPTTKINSKELATGILALFDFIHFLLLSFCCSYYYCSFKVIDFLIGIVVRFRFQGWAPSLFEMLQVREPRNALVRV